MRQQMAIRQIIGRIALAVAFFLSMIVTPFAQTGAWYVTGERDRFGDGSVFVASTVAKNIPTLMLAVRCIRREWSVAILDAGFDPKPLDSGESFELKFRVDDRPVIETDGTAISDRLIQITTTPDMIRDILGGRELALRLMRRSVSYDVFFAISNARKALARHMTECPHVD